MEAKMKVGHPVTVPSGAHGIISVLRENGVTDVELLGGTTVRIPYTALKSYFENPMPTSAPEVSDTQAPIKLNVRAQILDIIKVAGDKRMTAKEIFAEGVFDSLVRVSAKLSVLHLNVGVLGREKRWNGDVIPVYEYWLIPSGAELPPKVKPPAQSGQVSRVVPSPEGHAAGVVLDVPALEQSVRVSAFKAMTEKYILDLEEDRTALLHRVKVIEERIGQLSAWLNEDAG